MRLTKFAVHYDKPVGHVLIDATHDFKAGEPFSMELTPIRVELPMGKISVGTVGIESCTFATAKEKWDTLEDYLNSSISESMTSYSVTSNFSIDHREDIPYFVGEMPGGWAKTHLRCQLSISQDTVGDFSYKTLSHLAKAYSGDQLLPAVPTNPLYFLQELGPKLLFTEYENNLTIQLRGSKKKKSNYATIDLPMYYGIEPALGTHNASIDKVFMCRMWKYQHNTNKPKIYDDWKLKVKGTLWSKINLKFDTPEFEDGEDLKLECPGVGIRRELDLDREVFFMYDDIYESTIGRSLATRFFPLYPTAHEDPSPPELCPAHCATSCPEEPCPDEPCPEGSADVSSSAMMAGFSMLSALLVAAFAVVY